MAVQSAYASASQLPSDVSTSLAILGRMTGSPAQARALIFGTVWPGNGFQGIAAMPPAAAPARRDVPGSTVRIGNLVYTASMLLQQFTQMRAQDQVEAAIVRFHLDRGQASHLLSAYAYVWARNMAPLIPRFFWKLLHAGDRKGLNERFAQALGRYERDNPGTVFLAMRGGSAAQRAVEMVLDQSLAGITVSPPIQVSERTSTVDPALSASSVRARALLGIQSNRSWVAHHLIPFASVAALPEAVQQAIVASGWRMEAIENLIALPTNQPAYIGPPNLGVRPMHGGAHTNYNAAVSVTLSSLTTFGISPDPAIIRPLLTSTASRFRRELVRNRALWHPRVG